MRNVLTAWGVVMACAVGAQAGQTVVVELYTSQGCVSCPPADDYLATLADRTDVIPLALHVDYWDYIGWKDNFADPRFTRRQKAYARAAGSRMVYTPQFIIAGQDRIEGLAPDEAALMMRRHLEAPAIVTLDVRREDDRIRIEASTATSLPAPVEVQLVRYRPEETVTIDRGENAGRTITYRNVVSSWETLGEWTGEAPLEAVAPVTGADPAVVILQSPGPAAILAAARVP